MKADLEVLMASMVLHIYKSKHAFLTLPITPILTHWCTKIHVVQKHTQTFIIKLKHLRKNPSKQRASKYQNTLSQGSNTQAQTCSFLRGFGWQPRANFLREEGGRRTFRLDVVINSAQSACLSALPVYTHPLFNLQHTT